jgi:beta-hydroxylase
MAVDTPQLQQQQRMPARPRWVRPLKRTLKTAAVLVPLMIFLPGLILLYALCGLYDVARNRQVDQSLLDRYFLGNGVFLWILSPLNILFDIVCLPYRNKGIYRLADLPPAYQQEITRIIQAATGRLVDGLQEKTRGQNRSMFFFKWYGTNIDTELKIPEFHEPYRYVKTIGVSVFNQRESTTEHFGFVRPTLRVLYSITDFKDESAYIKVGPATSYWRDSKLFIFDDTLLHQSVNESGQSRYCMFLDIVRPSHVPWLLGAAVTVIRVLTKPFNFIFYQQWKLVRP